MTSEDRALGKRVLVVDNHPEAQQVRIVSLWKHGVEVHTVSTIEEARSRLRDDTYDLVLVATRENPEGAIAFRQEIHRQNPKQRVAFLVGPPHYIAFTLGSKQTRIEPKSEQNI